MLIFQKNRNILKIIMITQIFFTLLTSSCTLKTVHENDEVNFQKARSQLKELIIPKGISVPIKNKEYNIPYKDKDLETKNYNILPPV